MSASSLTCAQRTGRSRLAGPGDHLGPAAPDRLEARTSATRGEHDGSIARSV